MALCARVFCDGLVHRRSVRNLDDKGNVARPEHIPKSPLVRARKFGCPGQRYELLPEKLHRHILAEDRVRREERFECF